MVPDTFVCRWCMENDVCSEIILKVNMILSTIRDRDVVARNRKNGVS